MNKKSMAENIHYSVGNMAATILGMSQSELLFF